MLNNDISDQDLVRILRAKAAKYQAMADTLEHGADLGAPNVRTRGRAVPPPFVPVNPSDPHSVTADAIKELIGQRGYRAGDLAVHFNVPIDVIKSIIADPKNGLNDRERGWVRET